MSRKRVEAWALVGDDGHVCCLYATKAHALYDNGDNPRAGYVRLVAHNPRADAVVRLAVELARHPHSTAMFRTALHRLLDSIERYEEGRKK